VIWVTWEEAKGYVTWLKRMSGKDYRLLSNAEWEYAAKAGNPGRWSFGDDEAQLGDYTWFSENPEYNDTRSEKKHNAFGLYDMHGNVFQWVEDSYHENYDGAPSDGSVLGLGSDASRRVVRGGSWSSSIQLLRSASRSWSPSGVRNFDLGFRVGRTLTP
jgi:formylglycine-generating enzyme required for sulfatase activity